MKRFLFLFAALMTVCGALISSNFVLVIDPGHGGRDPGSMRGSIREKEINLAVALELGKLVEANMPDVKVVYTRKTDVFVPLEKRTRIANDNKANLFISIHTNSTAAKTTSAIGADTYILGLARSAENLAVAKRENSVIKYEEDFKTKYEGFDPDSPESYIIFEFMTNHYMQQSLDVASLVQSSFKQEAKRVDRGVRQAGFLVLRESGMPSVLIELGFINNPKEAKYLNSEAGQKAMGKSIYQGFKKYKESFDKVGKETTPVKTTSTKPVIAEKEQPKTSTTIAANNNPKGKEEQSALNTAKDGNIEYRVQFLYSARKLPQGSSLFKGIEPTGEIEENGYKYTVGATTDYNEIVRLHNEVKKKFSDAFIVKFDGSQRSVIIPTQRDQQVAQQAQDTQNQPKVSTQAKPKEQTSTPTKAPASQSSIPAGVIEYRVQFLYSPTKLEDNSPKLKGMKNVSYYIDNGYKYTVGSTTDFNEIRKVFREVNKKFSDAFIIKMKDGKRI